MAKLSRKQKVARLAAMDRGLADARQRVRRFTDKNAKFVQLVAQTLRENCPVAGLAMDSSKLDPQTDPFTAYECFRDFLAYVGWCHLMVSELQNDLANEEEGRS